MLEPWLELPGAAARVRWLSALTGLDLLRLGTTADADEIRDTAVAQPLIVTIGLLAAAELPTEDVGVTAGHSVGEFTAAAVAGVFSPEIAVALAAFRGRAMAQACAAADTGMSAVLGGDPAEVLARIQEYGLTPANRNAAGQTVAAGTTQALARLAQQPPAGARVRPLAVAGAFHTEHMAPAQVLLAELIDGITTSDPQLLLLSNADGTSVATGREVLKRLVGQLTSPVRWDLCQSTLRDLEVSALIELPPAGTLTGLAKRELPDIPRFALKSPDDLAAARLFIADTASSGQASHIPDWRVVVAPARGTFHPVPLDEGAHTSAGTPLGEVRSRREDQHVSAGYDGILLEWLAQDGDPVDAGDPLARLIPEPNPSEAAR
jgi:[acyl-carrier-protein] S-malonyltransferase